MDEVKDRGVIAWFARNSVAANLLMWAIIVTGLIALPSLKVEVFPDLPANLITVGIVYPGASPEEVEESICVRIEEAVHGLTGIKQITSTANEGAGAVSIEVLPEADLRTVLDDVKTRVDAITTFPAEAERPVIQEVIIRTQVINVAIHGPADEASLKHLGERVRDEISALPGITQVELSATRPYEISIELSEQALRRHGLSFQQVADAVRSRSLDLPGGSIKTTAGEVLVRSKGQAYRGPDFEQIVVLARADGTRVLLGDVATVVDGFADTDQSATFDGRPCALVQVFRVGQQNALDVSRQVHEYIARAQATMPEGVTLTTWADAAEFLKGRIDLLVEDAGEGFLLVCLLLALFLRLRIAFWVAMGIPIAFLGAIALMPALGVSINMISLFAFIVVLGIVTDDAIVVGENVHRHMQTEPDKVRATILGAREVAVSVTFGVLTTVAAYLPMFNVPGPDSKIWRVIPLIAVSVLLASLVESKLILPAHLAHMKNDSARPWLLTRLWTRVQRGVDFLLAAFVRRVFQPTLEAALHWRYLASSLGLLLLMLAAGLVGVGAVKFVFFPNVEGDNVIATLVMPQGTPVEATRAAVRHLESTALAVGNDFAEPHLVRHVLASVGEQPFRTQANRRPGGTTMAFTGSHLGEVNIQLLPSESRTTRAQAVIDAWRERAGTIADAVELTFSSSLFATGDDINVQLASTNLEDLRHAAEELKAQLATYAGVVDISDTHRSGKDEVQLAIREEAEPLGLDQAALARQVRAGFYGEEAQRIQRGRDDVKVMVRYPEAERRSLGDLDAMRVRTPSGDEVPFDEVAHASYGRGFASIKRTDRRRTVNVTATIVDKPRANEINAALQADVLPHLKASYSGLDWSFEGAQKNQAEAMGGLQRGFVLVLFLIYALIAIPLKSYLQPLVVMTAIPFGFVGALIGHMVMGYDLSIMSMFGLIALAGVAVNDAIVLIEFINNERERGTPLLQAVRDAGVVRLRPILLNSLTTFGGLGTLMFATSVQAKFLVPMAISLGYGVMFCTFTSLLLVPCLYLMLEDGMRALRWLSGRDPAPAAAATRAP